MWGGGTSTKTWNDDNNSRTKSTNCYLTELRSSTSSNSMLLTYGEEKRRSRAPMFVPMSVRTNDSIVQ